MPNEDLSQLIDVILVAARDLNVFFILLFILGIAFIILSLYDIQPMGIKIQPRPEYRKWTIMLGFAIALVSFLLLLSIWFIPKVVAVYGTVTYEDGSPVRNADIFIGSLHVRTDMDGDYKISNVTRNQTLISINIKKKHYVDTLDLPDLYWRVNKDIHINNIKMKVSGVVSDENGNEVEGAYVNLSGDIMQSNRTDYEGRYDFGTLCIPFVPAKPLILTVLLPNETKPRFRLNIEIPSEEPFENYTFINLPSIDKVDVSGKVILCNNSTCKHQNPTELPIVIVTMGGRSNQIDDLGDYYIRNVPIDTIEYEIWSPNKVKYCNRTIYSPLMESEETPRSRNLILYSSEINVSKGE